MRIILFILIAFTARAQCIPGNLISTVNGMNIYSPGQYAFMHRNDTLIKVWAMGADREPMPSVQITPDTCLTTIPELLTGSLPYITPTTVSGDTMHSPPNFLTWMTVDIDSIIARHCPPLRGAYASRLQLAFDSLAAMPWLNDDSIVIEWAKCVNRYLYYTSDRYYEPQSLDQVFTYNAIGDSGTWCGGFAKTVAWGADSLRGICVDIVGVTTPNGGHSFNVYQGVIIDPLFGIFDTVYFDQWTVYKPDEVCLQDRAEYVLDSARRFDDCFVAKRTVENYLRLKEPGMTPAQLYSLPFYYYTNCIITAIDPDKPRPARRILDMNFREVDKMGANNFYRWGTFLKE